MAEIAPKWTIWCLKDSTIRQDRYWAEIECPACKAPNPYYGRRPTVAEHSIISGLSQERPIDVSSSPAFQMPTFRMPTRTTPSALYTPATENHTRTGPGATTQGKAEVAMTKLRSIHRMGKAVGSDPWTAGTTTRTNISADAAAKRSKKAQEGEESYVQAQVTLVLHKLKASYDEKRVPVYKSVEKSVLGTYYFFHSFLLRTIRII